MISTLLIIILSFFGFSDKKSMNPVEFSEEPTCDVHGSGQRDDESSVQLLRLACQECLRLGLAGNPRQLRLHLWTAQTDDQSQSSTLNTKTQYHQINHSHQFCMIKKHLK